MSSWLEPDRQETATVERDERYLRFDNPEKTGESVEVTLRILDERPVRSFRHWFENRPYNCPGIQNGCPACVIRMNAKKAGNENWRDIYPSQMKYLINVLVEGEPKIWAFGQKIGNRITFYAQREGDPRGYDLLVIKRRTGPNKLNIEYDVFKGKESPINAQDYDRFNLEEEIAPAANEDIKAAMDGGLTATPVQTGFDVVENVAGTATPVQIAMLKKLASDRNFTLEQLGVNVQSLTRAQAEEYIADLSK